jgi:MYXO-CTERM domain-containing protein
MLVLSLVIGCFLLATTASAVPTVTLHTANAGIASINVTVTGTLIEIEEIWTTPGFGFLQISGLEVGRDYTVVKHLTNNTGVDWTRLANELLDPQGDGNDDDDPDPQPLFVPAGFSTSNDFDGLSFAQGSPIPRTSNVFLSVEADELTDARDFLDFFNGTLANGATGMITFGLRDNGENQPFLLAQRPNVASTPTPEPTSVTLLGLALLGLAGIRARRRPRT